MTVALAGLVLLVAGAQAGRSWETEGKAFKDRVELGFSLSMRLGALELTSSLNHKANETLGRDQRERGLRATVERHVGSDRLRIDFAGWRRGDSAAGHRHRVDGLELRAQMNCQRGRLSLVPAGWWLRQKTTVPKGPGRSGSNHGGGGRLEGKWFGAVGEIEASLEGEAREETSVRASAAQAALRGAVAGVQGKIRAQLVGERRGYPLSGGETEKRDTRRAEARGDAESELASGWKVVASLRASGQEAVYRVRPEGGFSKAEVGWSARLSRGTERQVTGELALEQSTGRDTYRRSLNNRTTESRKARLRLGVWFGRVNVDGSAALDLNRQLFSHPSNPDDRDQASRVFDVRVGAALGSGFHGGVTMGYRETRLVYPEKERSAASNRRRLYTLQPTISWGDGSGLEVEGTVSLRADYQLYRFRDELSSLGRARSGTATVRLPVGAGRRLTVALRSLREDEGAYAGGRFSIGGETGQIEVTSRLLGWTPRGVTAEPSWGFRRRWSRGWGVGSFTESHAGLRLAGSSVTGKVERVWRRPGEDYWEAAAALEGTL